MKRVRDWLVTIPTLVVFGLVLGIGDLAQRVTYRMGMHRYERTMGTIQNWLLRSFRLAGARFTIEHRDRVPSTGPVVVISNHQAMLDIPILGATLSDMTPRFVSKRSLASGIPTVSLYLRRGGNALIDRDDRKQAMHAIKQMAVTCRDRGAAAVIFPEGTRSRDGALGLYRVTGAAALMEAASDVPVVPAAIDGSWRLFASNLFPVPFGVQVRVRFGDPIELGDGDDPAAVVARCRTFAEETLAEWHDGPSTGR